MTRIERLPCKRFLVSGRVQGVYYRASARSAASRLGLHGWAKNLADGRVEVVVRGEEDAIDQMRTWLERGPPNARVTGVESLRYDGQVHPGFLTL
jgi:acylphosphatase